MDCTGNWEIFRDSILKAESKTFSSWNNILERQVKYNSW